MNNQREVRERSYIMQIRYSAVFYVAEGNFKVCASIILLVAFSLFLLKDDSFILVVLFPVHVHEITSTANTVNKQNNSTFPL